MTFEDIKKLIETNNIPDTPILFRYSDSPFIPYQYIQEISKLLNKEIDYIKDIASITSNSIDIFNETKSNNTIRCLYIDEVDKLPKSLKNETHLYIIAKEYSQEVQDEYKTLIVDIPKLETWHIKDYTYSIAEGIDTKELDWLIEVCHSDIYRLTNELDKLCLFDKEQRPFIFKDMKVQGAFNDLSNKTVFDLTNAIIKKDLPQINSCLEQIKSFDAEPLGIVTILYNQFKKLIQVWLHPNPTEESTGLKSNVIYAIKKSPRVYSQNQLINAFIFISGIDRMLKTGQIEIPWLIDYIICNCLTC